MKKRFLFIPLLIITLLMSCITMSASADGAVEYSPGLDTYYDTPDQLLTYMSNRYHVTVSDYIYIKYYNVNSYSNEQNQYLFKSALLYSNGDITVSENNGVYTFNSSSNFYYAECMTIAYIGNGEDIIGSKEYSVPELGSQIIYYSNTPDLLYSNYGYSVAGSSLLNGSLYNEILDVEYDLDGVHWDSNSINVTVTFNPDLTGNINRTRTLNDVTATIDFLNMKVYNNSSYGIQYFMCICEQGYSPSSLYSYQSLSNGDSLTMSFDSNCRFVYLCEEDVYLNQINTFKSLIVSPWHFVPANSSTQGIRFNWSNFDLAANHNYDVVVYAMRNDYDAVSTIADEVGNFILPEGTSDVQGKSAHSVDFTSCVEVYRSTFSVQNPAVYDPDSGSGGIIANNPDYDYRSNLSFIRGYYDEYGGYHTADYDLLKNGISYLGDEGLTTADKSPFYHDYSNYNNYSYNHTSYKSTSYSGLLSETTGVLSFFSSVLGFFPTQVITVYNIGLWSMIIILILRRLH